MATAKAAQEMETLVCWDGVLVCSPGRPGTHSSAQADLKLAIVLCQSLQCYSYRPEAPCLAGYFDLSASFISFLHLPLLLLRLSLLSLLLSSFSFFSLDSEPEIPSPHIPGIMVWM